MKTYIGSIQRKGRRLYLVTRCGTKQKWIALHTDSRTVARFRASMLAPSVANDEILWLRQLARIGETARQELVRRQAAANIKWENLWQQFVHSANPPIPAASRPTYRRWLDLLHQTVKALPKESIQHEFSSPRIAAANSQDNYENLSPALMPASLSRSAVERVATSLRASHLSADRMLHFFQRVWRTLSLDERIWADIPQCNYGDGPLAKEREFYRRLTVPEVRRIVAMLTESAEDKTKCALADMIVIGYYTGLRLSDVAELEESEISTDVMFLHIQPNKVRRSKPRLLTIPLVGRARSCIKSRLDALKVSQSASRSSGEETACNFLFPSNLRRHPSKKLSAAFRACGVMRQGNGRASFHSLRATFISLMDEAGVPPHLTDAITGHSAGGMHARYTQPSAAALANAVRNAMPPI